MQTIPPHTVPVISPHQFDWGPLYWSVYGTTAILLIIMMAGEAGYQQAIPTAWTGIPAVIVFFLAITLGAPYRIIAHLTLEADHFTVEWRNGRQVEFPLSNLEQLLVRIGSAASDGVVTRGNHTRILIPGGSGLDNYLDCVSEWGVHSFKFRLDEADIAPLNVCLYAWTQAAINLRIEDRSGRNIPYLPD